MTQFIINIRSEANRNKFLEALSKMAYAEIVSELNSPAKRKIARNLAQAFHEVKQHDAGLLKLKSAKQFLDEA